MTLSLGRLEHTVRGRSCWIGDMQDAHACVPCRPGSEPGFGAEGSGAASEQTGAMAVSSLCRTSADRMRPLHQTRALLHLLLLTCRQYWRSTPLAGCLCLVQLWV